VRALSSALRRQLEASVLAARRAAESASRAGLETLGVFADRRPEHLDASQAELRNGLRAKQRQLGGDPELLVAECAYEQWHRLLFARFLAENGLLLHPQYRAPVTLADCEELAAELGEPDAWAVAARFAAEILPGIFRLDDPCAQLRLAPEGRHALEQILDALPAEAFAADDALGWVYQFWQKDKKDEVNASERKIGGADLGPVTQLFTESYMVRFLLENSLGAWWAGRHPESPLTRGFEYLRRDEEGRPAAGSFDGWPDRVAELTAIDPCCGSGHFLVVAFSMLWQMRAEEEGLTPVEAQDAVLRDNLFGLELDPRCVQIAMFAVALQAWKAGGGWRQLPVPNIACSGIPVKAPVEEWRALAGDDKRLENALVRLHILFGDADTLGSLIDPRRTREIGDGTELQRSLEDVDWQSYAPQLEAAMSRERGDPATAVLGADASATARAANLLARDYTLVVTNVPFLARGRQSERLAKHLERMYPAGKGDLATAVLSRVWGMTAPGGTSATVSPVQWLFLSSYAKFRQTLLRARSLSLLGRLGARAFTGIGGEVAAVGLCVESNAAPWGERAFGHLDLTKERSPEAKAAALLSEPWDTLHQSRQAENPSQIISAAYEHSAGLLSDFADGYAGIQTGDLPRFVRFFWELDGPPSGGWAFYQGTVDDTAAWGGLEKVLLWEDGEGTLHRFVSERLDGNVAAWIRGVHCRGRRGVSVSQMGDLPVALYSGELFDLNNAVILPKKDEDLAAIWHFCSSPEFAESVRAIDQSLKVTNRTLVKVPFDAVRWRQVAAEAGPLPEPRSDDPTQWLFEGRPETSTAALQVAVARLVGYRWPGQPASDELAAFADPDGIACLPAVAGEPRAADRVQQLLAAAFGEEWSQAKAEELLRRAGSTKKSIEEWLRDQFFKQHCSLFGNRPFVWHIWDGRRDGFSALVDYHRLDRRVLERLTYTYLGQDWVERQRAEAREEAPGAGARLEAALELQRKLEAILEGEEPYDVYVRWKQLRQQPQGWEPDLNDGVRLNVRPFVEAGVLRASFNVRWGKDRGKDPDGSARENDVHLSLAAKREAHAGAVQA
jgi:hypothetical protein